MFKGSDQQYNILTRDSKRPHHMFNISEILGDSVTVVVIIFAVVAVAVGRSTAQLICHVTGEASQPAAQPPCAKGCGRHFEETRRC